MPCPVDQLRRDAFAIWQAGVEAVRSDRLIRETLRVEGSTLSMGDLCLDLDAIGRIAVVGAGKAGAGMAAGVEAALGPRLLEAKHVAGWINVPEDCVRPLCRIHLHGARPAGVNEPTAAGAAGSEEILRMVASLGPNDLCLCLISGGGSALMPAPVEGVTLKDKLALTRHLSSSGANIEQLNTVRKQLSRIKGGGLARACRAGRLVALIISDVLGDPLDVIASGPTVADSATPADALAVLERFASPAGAIPERVFSYLRNEAGARHGSGARRGSPDPAETTDRQVSSDSGRPAVTDVARSGDRPQRDLGAQPQRDLGAQPQRDGGDRPQREAGYQPQRVTNLIIGNNATAVRAAGREAERLGYTTTVESANRSEGLAEDLGRQMAETAIQMRGQPGARCLVSGGEPVVKLIAAAQRGLGGRNQQLVLAALERLADDGAAEMAILSGGTDGEDGPTDAAGAIMDAAAIAAAQQRGLCPRDYLARNDAYRFFDPLNALLRTGPTHTNVCDLRVVLTQGGMRRGEEH